MPEIKYSITRSKRRTICIVIREGKVEIKAPFSCPLEKIQAFVADKNDWIEKKIQIFRKKAVEFEDFILYRKFSVLGNKLTPLWSAEIKNVTITPQAIYLPQTEINDGQALLKKIGNAYKKQAQAALIERLDYYSDYYKTPYRSFKITNSKSKWGSCDSANHITLNWRLYMLNENLIKYVIIHELCHTYYHNHGKQFWESVKKRLPQYKVLRRELKEENVFITLLR